MNPEVVYYFYSLLIIIAVYVLGRSAHELYKSYNNPYSWRWGLIILMAIFTFYHFGVETQTFNFMWQKTKEFWNNPPWQEEVQDGATGEK